jgi:tetratricopeptide (TPR) repeat protein
MSLKVTGKDAFSFLKAQSSNDLDESKRNFTAFLKNKAEIVALAAIEKVNESYEIFTLNPDILKEHLEKFIIVEDVEIEFSKKEMMDIGLDLYEAGQSLIKLEEAHPGIMDKYVSFTKGCFPGQEVLSKYKNIGLKKKEERSKRYTDEALEIFAQAKNNSTDLDSAIELLKKAIKENPKNEDAYESLGVMLAKQEKFKEAIAVMQQLEMINPQNPMALMNLSIFFMKIGDKETAEEYKAKGTVLQFEEALKK